MALTDLNIYLNRKEVSRFEPSRSKLKVRVVPVPATGIDGEAVTVSLFRKNGLEVKQETLTFGADDYTKGAFIEFDVAEIKDSDGFPICLQGEYYVKAVQSPIEKVSSPVYVSMITVDEMKSTYAFGCTLYASEVLAPKKQPALVTGVTIKAASEKTPAGIYSLVYDNTNGTLSWNGGAAVTLDVNINEEVLPDLRGNYITVEIDHFELPGADASEGIVLDKQVMTDEALRGQIRKAVTEVEKVILKVFVEPNRIATEPYYSNPEAGEWFDRKVPDLAYYENDFNRNMLAWHLDPPVYQLKRIDEVKGYMGNTPVLDVKSGAYTVNEKSGILDILPYNSEYSYLWMFLGQFRFWGFRRMIPGFWRYKGVAGIYEKGKDDIGDILKMIGYTAAIPLLSIAGQAYRAGFASESTSKDGVTRSASYTSSATFGIYSAPMKECTDWLKENKGRLIRHYRGISVV